MRKILSPSFLLFLCCLPFLPGLFGPYQLDDLPNLKPLFAAAEAGHWRSALFDGESGFLGRPLATGSFLLNYLAFGPFAASFKLVNLLLHLLNAALVLRLARELLPLLVPHWPEARRTRTATLAAMLWLLHPMQVSTVLYAVQRMTQLSTLCLLAALIVCARFLRRPQPGAGDGLRTALIAGGLGVLGLLAKETAVLLPVLIGVLWLTRAPPAAPSRTHRLFAAAVIWLPVAALIAYFAWYLGRAEAAYAHREFSLGQRLATEPLVLLDYLRNIAWPDIRRMGLHLDGFPLAAPGDAASLLATLAIALAAGAALFWRRRFPLPAFAVLWFLGCHVLESGVIALELAFEHRNYLALLGPMLALAAGLSGLPKRLGLAGAGALLLAYATLTGLRAYEWSDEARFLQLESQRHPDSLKVWNNRAAFAYRTLDQDGMVQATQTLATRFPDSFFAQSQRLILMQCRMLHGPVDWPRLNALLRRKPADPWASSSLVALADSHRAPDCDRLPAERLQHLFAQALADYRQLGYPNAAEHALIAQARLRRNLGDAAGYRRLLLLAGAEAPASHQAELELIRYDFDNGRTGQALTLAARIAPAVRGREQRELQAVLASVKQ